MQIVVNGEARQLDAASNIADLLNLLGLPHSKIAVERNLEIVPKSAYKEIVLSDGDRIEIVHFIGGG